MLYQFPLPEWFGTGTTSLTVLTLLLWGTVIGMPASILGCWIFRPRSRIPWFLAEAFWVVGSIPVLFWWWPFRLLFPSGVNDAPVVLVLATIVILILMPVPAAIAGYKEMLRQGHLPPGFRNLPTWGCAIPCTLFFLFISIPPATSHREASGRSQCKNNLKQLGMAFYNYCDTHGTFPISRWMSENLPPRSWRVELLPMIDQKSAFDNYDQTRAWDSARNSPLSRQKLYGGYVCPSMPAELQRDTSNRYYTAYAIITGPGTAFPNGMALGYRQFLDGMTNTALVAEACGQQIVWTEPKDIDLTETKIGINLPGSQPHQSPGVWSSYHKRQAFTLLADGSVRSLNVNTDPKVLRAITTVNGGEQERLE